ncbi:hypothetical protein BH10PLA1_BH10PLA1_23170 [soil metagenome]
MQEFNQPKQITPNAEIVTIEGRTFVELRGPWLENCNIQMLENFEKLLVTNADISDFDSDPGTPDRTPAEWERLVRLFEAARRQFAVFVAMWETLADAENQIDVLEVRLFRRFYKMLCQLDRMMPEMTSPVIYGYGLAMADAAELPDDKTTGPREQEL